MSRIMIGLLAAIALYAFAGCASSSGGLSPLAPQLKDTSARQAGMGETSTYLWGFYDVYLDFENQTATAVPNRDVEFASNIVKFLNTSASNLSIKFNGTVPTPDYIDVDMDVTIKHPFSGKPAYNGYDVRGIFLGNGSKTLGYDSPNLKVADSGDQIMYDFDGIASDPHSGKVGNPDGYTRWWNPTEFTSKTIFGYYPGNSTPKTYTATATLNPYKYFADGLSAAGDAFTFLKSTSGHGVFSSGSSNTRNYYLRFPKPSPGAKFGYAVVANWESPTVHPSNAPEAVACKAAVTPDLYYAGPSDKGGDLIVAFHLVGWKEHPGNMWIESTVLSAPHKFTSTEMIPTGGGSDYSTWSVEVAADNIQGVDGNQFWIVAEYPDTNYKNPYNVANSLGTKPIAAFFRYDLAYPGSCRERACYRQRRFGQRESGYTARTIYSRGTRSRCGRHTYIFVDGYG